jgi:phospholipase C
VTRIVPFSEVERDAANGTLPDFSLIEPHLVAGHGDYHPAEGRSLIGDDVNIAIEGRASACG